MPAKQARGLETVERLLDAAMEVYEEVGPEGFTMTAVIERSGVSVGSLYHHFGSFNGLAAALYARCADELLDTLLAAVGDQSTAKHGIRTFVLTHLRWLVDNRAKAHFMLALPYQGLLAPHAERAFLEPAPAHLALTEWARPHLASGRIRDLPPALLECLVTGPVTETVTRWLIDMSGTDMEEAFAVLPECVWQSVRGPCGED